MKKCGNHKVDSKKTDISEALIQKFAQGKIYKASSNASANTEYNKKQELAQNCQTAPLTSKRKDYLKAKVGGQKQSIELTHELTEPSLAFATISCRGCEKVKEVTETAKCQILKLNLFKQYTEITRETNVETINKIVYNEKAHVVAVFKDYLIYDDIKEFFNKLLSYKESLKLFKRISANAYAPSPCYALLTEKAIIQKAREKKEKIRRIKEADAKKGQEGSTFFRTGFMDSLAKEDLLNSRTHLPANSLECSGRENLQIAELLKQLNECDRTKLLSKPIAKPLNNTARGPPTNKPKKPLIHATVKIKPKAAPPKPVTRNPPVSLNTLSYTNTVRSGTASLNSLTTPSARLFGTYYQEKRFTPRTTLPEPAKAKPLEKLLTVTKKLVTSKLSSNTSRSNSKKESYFTITASTKGRAQFAPPHSSAGIYFATKKPAIPLNQKANFTTSKEGGASSSRNLATPQNSGAIHSLRVVCCSEIGHHKVTVKKPCEMLKTETMRGTPILLSVKAVGHPSSQQITPRGFGKNTKGQVNTIKAHKFKNKNNN